LIGEIRLYAVIPAGGSGSRLWPRSRRSSPKHLLALSGSGKTLLAESIDRVAPLARDVSVLTEERQVPLIESMIPGLDRSSMIVEPAARGTTNALGLAAMTLLERDRQAVMISTAADHVIRGTEAYQSSVRRAAAVAQESGELVTIGLPPRHPATGFGYIEAGDQVEVAGETAYRVRRFTEKPPAPVAREYLASGRHYWNLNMFCWRCDSFVEELRLHGPEHHAGLLEVMAARRAGDEAAAARAYQALPVAAVDYTVMEKSSRLLLVPAEFDWVDVGSWTELADLRQADPDGNVVEDGQAVLLDTRDSFISVPGKLVAIIGVSDLIVVETEDALLVCPRSRAQDVKKVVEALGQSGQTGYL
jgi:mannose-1-phosphate guanylyltransferase